MEIRLVRFAAMAALALCLLFEAQGQGRADTASDIGLVDEMLSLKDINCAYDFAAENPDQITVITIKLYKDAHEKREALPELYPNFKQAMSACGEWYDRTNRDHKYAVAYRKNTVSAKK